MLLRCIQIFGCKIELGVPGGKQQKISKSKKIYEAEISLLTNKDKYQMMSKAINPYGDGKASERIVSICLNKLKNR